MVMAVLAVRLNNIPVNVQPSPGVLIICSLCDPTLATVKSHVAHHIELGISVGNMVNSESGFMSLP